MSDEMNDRVFIEKCVSCMPTNLFYQSLDIEKWLGKALLEDGMLEMEYEEIQKRIHTLYEEIHIDYVWKLMKEYLERK